MQKTSIFRSVVALACAAALTVPAFADIKAFNAAVKAGDYKTAAAEAEATWKTWDKSSTSAVSAPGSPQPGSSAAAPSAPAPCKIARRVRRTRPS